jgi:hypothetical protein
LDTTNDTLTQGMADNGNDRIWESVFEMETEEIAKRQRSALPTCLNLTWLLASVCASPTPATLPSVASVATALDKIDL